MVRTFSRREAVDLVRFLAVARVKLAHLLDVGRFVERAPKSRLQLRKVRRRVTVTPTTGVASPLLRQSNTHANCQSVTTMSSRLKTFLLQAAYCS